MRESASMAEVSLAAPPERAALLGQIGARIADLDPSLRVVARDLLAAERSIDFVAVDNLGRAVLVLVGEERGDLTLVAQGLAHRAWVTPRLQDWLQLSPNLGIRPEAGVRVVLLSPDFGPDARAAAAAGGGSPLELAIYRCVRNGAWEAVLVEPLEARTHPPRGASPAPAPPIDPPHDSPTRPASFRTGLREEDLALDASTPAPRE
jgi:hypothetical protein